MGKVRSRGTVYRCPVCGSELAVIGRRMRDFRPRCCNTDMLPAPGRVRFFVCPVCGAQIGVLRAPGRNFRPRCCNTDMIVEAA